MAGCSGHSGGASAPETTVLEAEPTPHVRPVYADLRARTETWTHPTRTEGTS